MVIDLSGVMTLLSATSSVAVIAVPVVYDWQTFAPIAKYLMESYKITVNPWGASSG